MLSRIFWVGLAVLALVAGMLLQNGDEMLAWTGYHDMSGSTERSVERRLDRALDRSFDRMEVHGADGGEIDVPAETKRAMASAVGELIKAETALALARIGDDEPGATAAAEARRARARADVERLKTEIERLESGREIDRQRLRDEIRTEVQENVRTTVREAVRN
jgi:hypothetical protein